MIKAVFFDLGDTLWHFPHMPPRTVAGGETYRRIKALINAWGYEMSGDRKMFGRDIRLAIEAATEKAFHGDCIDPDYPGICRRVAATKGLRLTEEQGAELWEAWNVSGAFLGRTLFPDAVETLGWLKARGYRLGAITNRGYAGKMFEEEMRHLGLADLLEVQAISCRVGYMKPDRRIFEYALEQLEVCPQEAVMVGDSLRGDIEGAKRIGVTAVWKRPPIGEPVEPTAEVPELSGPYEPDYTIERLSEIKSLPPFS